MKIATLSLGLVFSLLWIGCAGYQPLSTDSSPSFSLAPIQNETNAPQAVIPLQRSLRSAFLEAGVLEKSSENQLQVRLISYDRTVIARDSGDTGRPQSYRLQLTAELTWSGSSPSPFGEKPLVVSAEKSTFTPSSLIESERDAVSLIVRELTTQIEQAVVHRWND